MNKKHLFISFLILIFSLLLISPNIFSVKADNYSLPSPEITSIYSNASGKIFVNLSEVEDANQYQFFLAQDENFTIGKIAVYTQNTNLTSNKASLGTLYYARVRATKKENGRTIYSGWSPIVRVQTSPGSVALTEVTKISGTSANIE